MAGEGSALGHRALPLPPAFCGLGPHLCTHLPSHHYSLPPSAFSWALRPCLPTAHTQEQTEIARSPQSTAPSLLPSWGHDAVLLLLVIKKISQLPFHGCLATPKGEWWQGEQRGGGKGEDSGANLETKSRIWVTWSLFLVLTWPGRGDGWGRRASSHPSVSHQ